MPVDELFGRRRSANPQGGSTAPISGERYFRASGIDDEATAIAAVVAAAPTDYKANETFPAVGNLPEISKDGWDYIWYLRYPWQTSIGGIDVIYEIAHAAYVERVYRRAAFSAFFNTFGTPVP